MVEDQKSLRLRKLLAHGFMVGFIILIMFPFLMVLSISFREGNFSTGALLPENPTLEHWSLAFGIPFERSDGTVVEPPFPVMRWLWNSIKVALIASTGILALSTAAAYAFARMKFRGRGAMLDTLLIVQMFPGALTVIAVYAIFDALGQVVPWMAVDTHPALILTYLFAITLHI